MLRLISISKRESKAASREKELQVSEGELDLSAAAAAFRSGWRDENSVDVEDVGEEGDVVE